MATRYWVGGSGTWDTSSTTHWSASSGGSAGASAPVAADIVIFDSASGTGSYTVTYTSTIAKTSAGTTTINGPASGTLTFNLGANFSSSGTLTIGSTAEFVVFNTSASNYAVSSTVLTVGAGGTLTCNGSNVSCTTTSVTGTLNTASATYTGSGSFTVNSGGLVTSASSSISCSYLVVSSSGTFNAGTSVNCTNTFTSTNITGTLNTGSSTFTTKAAFNINNGGVLNAGSATISTGTTTTHTFTINTGGTLNGGTASITTTAGFTVAGSIATGTHSIYSRSFAVSSGGVVSAGALINPSTSFVISGGGSVSGVSAITSGASFTVNSGGSLTAGTSITSGTTFTITSGSATVFNAGAATITSNGNFSIGTAGTINMGTSTVICGGNFSISTGRTFYNVVLSPSSAIGYSLTGNNTFNNLTITGNTKTPVNSATSYGINLSAGSTQTINGTLTVTSGTDITYRTYLGINYNFFGRYATLNCAAVSLINTDFYGVTITGAAAPASGTNLGDIGENTGITFPASKTVYWNLAGTQSWTSTAWATSSGGTPALNNFPLPQDTAVFDNAGSAGTVTFSTTSNIKNLDFSGRTTAMSFANSSGAVILYLGGNLLFGTTATIGGRFYFINSSSKTLSGNNPNTTAVYLVNNSLLTLLNDALYLQYYGQGYDNCVLDLNGHTLTTNLSYGIQGNLTFNGGTLVSTGTQFDILGTTTEGTGAGTIRFTGSAPVLFFTEGTNLNCTVDYALTGAAQLTIYPAGGLGNSTFANITNSVSPASIAFEGGRICNFNNFNLRGTAGNLVTITSYTPGTQYTLSKASGAVSSNYLSLQDSIATGGAVWYAGSNSIDAGNNTGWIFKNASNGGMAIFLP